MIYMCNCMQGFFKKKNTCQIPFISDYGLFVFFKPNFKNPRTRNRIGSTAHPSSCFFLPGPKAPQRDTEHSLDCHSGRRSQRPASTVKLQSHVISQLWTSGKLSICSICKSNFAMTTLGKSPKNVCNSADLEVCLNSKFPPNRIIQKCNAPFQIETACVCSLWHKSKISFNCTTISQTDHYNIFEIIHSCKQFTYPRVRNSVCNSSISIAL